MQGKGLAQSTEWRAQVEAEEEGVSSTNPAWDQHMKALYNPQAPEPQISICLCQHHALEPKALLLAPAGATFPKQRCGL